mmetsp:Transcript_2967/g.8837  ORF Transcript_2967/g.8837 Transcript_2967/m.8837 type:complete len:91 (-) Transcript_2967:297-569(-)
MAEQPPIGPPKTFEDLPLLPEARGAEAVAEHGGGGKQVATAYRLRRGGSWTHAHGARGSPAASVQTSRGVEKLALYTGTVLSPRKAKARR